MKSLDELVLEKRWPDDDAAWPTAFNRGAGLLELCEFALVGLGHEPFIADVGVARGISTQIFAKFGTVAAVDHRFWQGTRDVLDDIPEVTTWECDSLHAADFFRKQGHLFDLVYLDTAHEQEWLEKEIAAWLPCIKKGGWIGGHDCGPNFPGVALAVCKVLGGWDLIYSDSSWIKRVL